MERARFPGPRRPRARLAWAGAALAVLLPALLLVREPLLRRLWPQSRAEVLERQAALALAAGNLSAPDGHGARELYEAALALDPDRPQAREGLQQVGRAALRAGQRAADAGRIDEARRMLDLARALQVPRVYSDALAEQVRSREAAAADIDRLLAAAAAARAGGRPEQAAAHYRRILELAPDDARALVGREDALADLLQQARRAIDEGRLHVAATLITGVRAYDAGHVDLPDTVAALSEAGERMRRRGDRALARGRLDDATAAYWAASAVDGEREQASQGLERVARAHAERARRLTADLRLDAARTALGQAEAIAPDLPAVRQARAYLDQVERAQRRRASSPARLADLQRLLVEAEDAERRGDLLLPPGDSAFDKLRAARALSPDDPRVSAALARLAPQARACFDRELQGNRLTRARHCLDAMQALGGESTEVRAARTRLAQRWVAVGDQSLGAGDVAAARRALDAARALDAEVAGASDLAQRLQRLDTAR